VAIGGVGNPSDGGTSGGSLGVYHAFIQFAGFTMGKTISQFDAPWTNYPGNNFDGLVGGSGTVTGVNQFTYTAQFGNGVVARVSAQDQTAYTQANLINTSAGIVPASTFAGGAYGLSDIGGSRVPDLIGVLKVDQAWVCSSCRASDITFTLLTTVGPKSRVILATRGVGLFRVRCRSRTSRPAPRHDQHPGGLHRRCEPL
jgi:hypothetical protein